MTWFTICQKGFCAVLPWGLKRLLLERWFGFRIDPSAHIGLAWIYPAHLQMGPNSRIASFSVAIHLDAIHMAEGSRISRGNWITGFPTGTSSPHFAHQTERFSELILGEQAAITKDHHIDCTNRVTIGAFSIVAGYRSQLLSHSIDLWTNRQHSEPIHIGDYCFVGTACVLLGGSYLPDYSVLGAMSLLNSRQEETWSLYAGQPANRKRAIKQSAVYFSRSCGFVN